MNPVRATRYVTPLREGGSLPGLMEADDLGMYVVKFCGAGQGPRALVAEVICAEIAGAIGLRVPRWVPVLVPEELAPAEPDEEVQHLLKLSVGMNLGIDFLPGALDVGPMPTVDPQLAGRIVWLDALITNADRSWRNPNMLLWHRALQLIDHGAALTFHHSWAPGRADQVQRFATREYDLADHALLECTPDVLAADHDLGDLDWAGVIAGAVADRPRGMARWGQRGVGWSGGREGGLPGVPAGSHRRPTHLGPGTCPGRRKWARPRCPGPSGVGPAEPGAAGLDPRAEDRAVGVMTGMPFEYAVLRIVPRVDRGEYVNGAVLLYCQQTEFLGMRIRSDLSCVTALWSKADVVAIVDALAAAKAVAEGSRTVGEVGLADPGRRFRWLTAPRSVVIQPGPVHTGVTDDPDAELDWIAEGMLD